MLLDKYKDDSYYFSGETSKLVNQFAFAGIAIIWIFKTDKPGQPLLPTDLIKPLFCFVVSLGSALLQNFIPSLIWSAFFRYHEWQNNGNTNIDKKANGWFSAPGWIFYFVKVVALITGFVFVASFLSTKINPSQKPRSATHQPTIHKNESKDSLLTLPQHN